MQSWPARKMELIRLGREPCSGSRLTLRKGGEVDEGATALRPAAALHGLFLFLVSIRCQTNDAVSRNTTAAGVCRGGEGVGVRDRGEKATFVGRSLVSILIPAPEILPLPLPPPPSQLSSTSSKGALRDARRRGRASLGDGGRTEHATRSAA